MRRGYGSFPIFGREDAKFWPPPGDSIPDPGGVRGPSSGVSPPRVSPAYEARRGRKATRRWGNEEDGAPGAVGSRPRTGRRDPDARPRCTARERVESSPTSGPLTRRHSPPVERRHSVADPPLRPVLGMRFRNHDEIVTCRPFPWVGCERAIDRSPRASLERPFGSNCSWIDRKEVCAWGYVRFESASASSLRPWPGRPRLGLRPRRRAPAHSRRVFWTSISPRTITRACSFDGRRTSRRPGRWIGESCCPCPVGSPETLRRPPTA